MIKAPDYRELFDVCVVYKNKNAPAINECTK